MDNYRIILSPRAINDLESIVRYISEDNPKAAKKLAQALVNRTKSLITFPNSGRYLPEFPNTEIRELILKPYRIIYRIDKDKSRIEISRFWHSARGIPLLKIQRF